MRGRHDGDTAIRQHDNISTCDNCDDCGGRRYGDDVDHSSSDHNRSTDHPRSDDDRGADDVGHHAIEREPVTG
jgi:hypothetical protein